MLLEKGLYKELDEQEQWKIEYFEESLEEIFDSLCMSDCTKKIVISGKESFVPGDLESGEGTYLFHMSLCALKDFVWDGVEDEEIEMEFAACGILADYYYRTCEIKDDEDITATGISLAAMPFILLTLSGAAVSLLLVYSGKKRKVQ